MASADDFAPTIVHAYDNKSYFFARLIARRHGAKRFLTKPAGPDPGVTFPHCPDVVCFSEENLAALRSAAAAPDDAPPLHTQTGWPSRSPIPKGSPPCGRGSGRGTFSSGSVASVNTTAAPSSRRWRWRKLMRAEGMPVRAVIIGALESQAVLDGLRARAEEGDVLLTEPSFAAESAALLDAATYVVGTGRGVVEAAMRRRIVFVPVAGSDVPALVTPSGWRALSWANFSARTAKPLGAGGR